MKFPAAEVAVRGSVRAYCKPWSPQGWDGLALIKEITHLHGRKCEFGDKYGFRTTITIEARTIYKNVILLSRFECVYRSVN